MIMLRLGVVLFAVFSVFCSSMGCVIVAYCRLVYMCAPNSGIAPEGGEEEEDLNEGRSTTEYHSELNGEHIVPGTVYSKCTVSQACSML
jgi:hypothetical protein